MRLTIRMKHFILSILFLPFWLNSQETAKKPSIIYYDDGSIYVGDILESQASRIKIVNVYGDTLILQAQYIKKIRHGGDIRITKDRKFHYRNGDYVDFTYGFSGNSTSTGIFLNMGIGHRLKENLNIGIGTGILGDSRSIRLPGAAGQWVWLDNAYVPVYASGQYYLSDWNNRPYVRQDLGYSFGLNNEWNNVAELKGGLYSKSSIGFHFASRKKMKFFIECFQVVQKSSGSGVVFVDFGDPVQYEFDIWSRRLGFGFGISFM